MAPRKPQTHRLCKNTSNLDANFLEGVFTSCLCSHSDEFCIKNKEFCIKDEDLCIKNEELCI